MVAFADAAPTASCMNSSTDLYLKQTTGTRHEPNGFSTSATTPVVLTLSTYILAHLKITPATLWKPVIVVAHLTRLKLGSSAFLVIAIIHSK